jgi:hypothetical protein
VLVEHSNAVQVGLTSQHSDEVHVLLAHSMLVGESFKRKSLVQVNPSQVVGIMLPPLLSTTQERLLVAPPPNSQVPGVSC